MTRSRIRGRPRRTERTVIYTFGPYSYVMSSKELEFNDLESLDGPDDVFLPQHAHHNKVRAELTRLAEAGVIDHQKADEMYDDWLAA